MNKYTHKSINLLAMPWTGTVDQKEELISSYGFLLDQFNTDGTVFLNTLHGVVTCELNDYIIQGVKGDFYPLRPEVFPLMFDTAVEKLVDFGEAIKAAKEGKKITRKNWNGIGMFVYFVPAGSYPSQTVAAKSVFGDSTPYRSYLALKTSQNDVATWSPSSSDSLAEDWLIID